MSGLVRPLIEQMDPERFRDLPVITEQSIITQTVWGQLVGDLFFAKHCLTMKTLLQQTGSIGIDKSSLCFHCTHIVCQSL